MDDFTPTDRTRIKRLHQRACYDRETVYAILDAGFVCHVGYTIDDHPYVTTTSYWREEDHILWHGSSASRMLRRVKGNVPVCVNVSLIDGLVLARSGFHHSINYRTVIMFGKAEALVDPDARLAALKTFTDRICPGRWDELRPVTDQELKATTVLRMAIDEVAAKVRSGPPGDDEEDYDLDVWAGEVPLRLVAGPPVPDPRLKAEISQPAYLDNFELEPKWCDHNGRYLSKMP